MIQIRTLPKTVLRHLPYWTGRRNWPTFLDHYNDPMDNFLDQLTTPMSVLMASVIEPKYEKKITKFNRHFGEEKWSNYVDPREIPDQSKH